MGFKQDRGHDLRNITTDAKHAYYGSYCDILVTNAKRMAEKTKAVYKDKEIRTKVITSNELMDCMNEGISHQFSLKPYIMDLGCNIHFKDTYQQGVAHCKYSFFETPFLCFFNYGMVVYNIDSHQPSFVFQRKLMSNDMVFYSEIDKLARLLKETFEFDSESDDLFNEVCDSVKMQGGNAVFKVRSKKWIFTYTTDPKFPRMPLIVITRTH